MASKVVQAREDSVQVVLTTYAGEAMASDRHGRAARTDGDRRRRPVDGFRMHDVRRFTAVVEDALATLPQALRDAAGEALVAVEDVPPAGSDAVIPLARFEPAQSRRQLPGKLILYRRPLELRALSRDDLAELIRAAAGREIARALGREADFSDEFDDPDE